jgi:hypothetical protein
MRRSFRLVSNVVPVQRHAFVFSMWLSECIGRCHIVLGLLRNNHKESRSKPCRWAFLEENNVLPIYSRADDIYIMQLLLLLR